MGDANGRWRSSALLLVLGLLALAFVFQGSRGIFAPDEGVHISIAHAMLNTGDWLMPRVEHELWLDKPPLSFWGIAAGMRLFGENEWGARVFHGLCFALTTVLVFLLGKSLGGRREGLLGATIYSTMVIPFAAANVLTPDTPLTLWTTASFYCFWKSVQPAARRVVLWKVLMCGAFALGFLTKGPAALIPSAPMFVFLLLRRRARSYLLSPCALVGLTLFAVLGLGWYAYVAGEIPGALAYFWDNEVFGRIFSGKYHRNGGWAGALIYLPVVLLGTLPWSLIWWRSLRRSGRTILTTSFWTQLRNRPAGLFLAVWIVVALLIFCTASSRLSLYLLPVFPAFALLCAKLWPSFSREEAWRGNPLGFSRRTTIALGLWVMALLGLKLGAAHFPHEKDMRALYALIEDKMPDEAYEIVSINEHVEGLGFYCHSLVERVTTKEAPYPIFIRPEHLKEEIEEITTSKYAHVFLCPKEGYARMLREVLADANIVFEQSALAFHRYLFVCRPARKDRYGVRLIAMGDTGQSHVSSVANALYLEYAEKSFDDGVLLLGDNLRRENQHGGEIRHTAQEEFEKPFADLLREGVPFYAALGNHDYDPGIKEFELRYPLFHMKGRRYYSQSYGAGLVDAFILDSVTLRDDPAQVVWLERSLAESKAAWKIVALHHPVHSMAMRHPPDPEMAERIEPILRRYGVSIVLQGHNHVYERLSPIHEITYMTVGSGGTVNKGDLRPDAPQRVAGNDQTEVFLMLEFDEATCHLTASSGLGTLVDEATILNGTRKHSVL